MNILPKKRWHVRTRENIARVRRDEAKAAEEEKERKARAHKAEAEAQINLLRTRTRAKYDGRDESLKEVIKSKDEIHEHVNFFKDLEEGRLDHNRPNDEHEAEAKAEKEKYEKQIGYLTYLGQDTNEATGSKCWYEKLPTRLTDTDKSIEIQESKKVINDPLKDIRKYLKIMGSSSGEEKKNAKKRKYESDSDDNISKKSSKKHEKKSKKRKKDKDKSSQKHNKSNFNLEKLRADRLLREKKEKLRTEALLSKLKGDPPLESTPAEPKITIKQKYNSQFCPEIARQNLEPVSRKR